MKKSISTFLFLLIATIAFGQADKISVVKNDKGMKLEVNGNDFLIKGMNWDYYPIGTNYTYILWQQPHAFIKAAIDVEMSLLKNMGVNTVRIYYGIQPEWIQYIYEKYGIYTILNHTFGRYGVTIDGAWRSNTDYSDPRIRQLLLKQAEEMVAEYKNTPGLLMYLLGNESNYGLFWEGAETEDIPIADRKSTLRAEPMYKLFNEAFVEMKKTDINHPVALCNGDDLFLDIIAKDCKDADVIGINCYRGKSFGDLFHKVKEAVDKPVLLTEFGADAYNEVKSAEDQKSQAEYDVSSWKEIYENVSGLGKAGNSIGGCTFQFSDGWWKYKQTKSLDIHDVDASWANGGYLDDFVPGKNNMNEEWFGICAKVETNKKELYVLHPRAAYYALKEVHKLDPYAKGTTLSAVDDYFSGIKIDAAVLKAEGDKPPKVGMQLGNK